MLANIDEPGNDAKNEFIDAILWLSLRINEPAILPHFRSLEIRAG